MGTRASGVYRVGFPSWGSGELCEEIKRFRGPPTTKSLGVRSIVPQQFVCGHRGKSCVVGGRSRRVRMGSIKQVSGTNNQLGMVVCSTLVVLIRVHHSQGARTGNYARDHREPFQLPPVARNFPFKLHGPITNSPALRHSTPDLATTSPPLALESWQMATGSMTRCQGPGTALLVLLHGGCRRAHEGRDSWPMTAPGEARLEPARLQGAPIGVTRQPSRRGSNEEHTSVKEQDRVEA